jgi:GT2 family glycosyltransferase/glycosyltransferase involved in cell wall biosynthesis
MRVMLFVHGYPPHAQGGSEIYAASHARTLANLFGDEVLVFTRDEDRSRPEYELREAVEDGVRIVRVNNTFRQVRTFAESYEHPRIAGLAAEAIEGFRPQVAHVHHLTCLSTHIPGQLASRGIPCFMTLHDYWLLCHRGQLVDRTLKPCAGPLQGCSRCVDDTAGVPLALGFVASTARGLASRLPRAATRVLREVGGRSAAALSGQHAQRDAACRRLSHMRQTAGHVTRFFAPSEHLRQRFVAAGFPADRIELSPYGFDHAGFEAATAHATARRPLRLGFIGSLMVSKAPHLLLEAAAMLPEGTVTVDLFGSYVPYHGDDSYRITLEPLTRAPWVRVHGNVPHGEMRRAYDAIDVLVVPSIWPENSPLVIHEAFLAGVAVVAADIGGIPELVEDDRSGLLFKAGDVVSLRSRLARLLQEPDTLERLRTHHSTVRTLDDDVRAMRDAYVEAGRPRPTPATPRVHAIVLNYNTPEATLLGVRSLLASRQALASILVVDNSEDVECGRALRDLSHHVEYFSTEANLGYSGGMNVGIRRALAAGASHVLLVNSDMTVPPDCVGRLLEALGRNPGAGIAGPTVLVRSTPDRIATAGISFHRTSGRMRQRLYDRPWRDVQPVSGAVDAVSGCLMLVDRRVLDDVGLMDEAYFFGFEDIELCLRAARRGFTTIVSDAIALHEGGQSLAASSPERLYYATRNHLRLAADVDPRSRLRSLLVLGYNLAYAMRASPPRLPSRIGAVVRGAADYLRGRTGAAGSNA